MMTIPGMSTMRTPTRTTIQCSCGADLCDLAPSEAVHPSYAASQTSGNTTKRTVECQTCRSKTTIPVTTHGEVGV